MDAGRGEVRCPSPPSTSLSFPQPPGGAVPRSCVLSHALRSKASSAGEGHLAVRAGQGRRRRTRHEQGAGRGRMSSRLSLPPDQRREGCVALAVAVAERFSPRVEAIASPLNALRSVRLTLRLERGDPHSLEVRPATPTQNRELLLKLLNLDLQAHPPQAGIVGVMLGAEPAQPQTAQRGLFQAQFPEPDKLELLLARLRSVAGQGNVGSPQLLNRHGDDAFAMAPFRPSIRAGAEREGVPSRLALRVFRPPQPVRVTCRADQPCFMSGRALAW